MNLLRSYHLWLSRLHPLLHVISAITPLAWNWGLTTSQPPIPVILLTALFGLLPDIDSHTSTLGHIFPFASQPIESRFGHRTITHSFLAVIIIGLLTYLLYQSHWVWLTAAYFSHILIDMIFGSGVPLLWPYPTNFYFFQFKSKTPAEGIFTIFATACLVLPFTAPAVTQRTYSTLTLESPAIPTPIPAPTKPTTFTIKIDNIYSIDDEILIQPGDIITPGQKLAALNIHRQLNTNPLTIPTATASQTPTPIPTPSQTPTQIPTTTPYPTIDPLTLQRLENERNLARARYNASIATPTPNINGLNLATEYDYKITEHQKCVQWWIEDGSPDSWQRHTCEAAANELIQTRNALLNSMQPAAIRPEDADILRLELQQSEIRYQIAIGQLTPRPTTLPTPTPAHTPTPTPTPTATQTPTPHPLAPTPTPIPLADPYTIYSQISGEVVAINLAAVNGNSVSIEIVVVVDPADPLFFNPINSIAESQQSNINNAIQAVVVRVVDGDTIVAQFDGREESIRLLGIDTPETVHPTIPPECYGAEASSYLKSLLPSGTNIQLETDSQTGQTDRYGRMLAHIWLGDQLVNESILLTGHGQFNNYDNPSTREGTYSIAEQTAITNQVGLWSACN
jgi:endonuclease YncB( thermonuclease family)/membrane-bound metal-dependent hydrolase YbcI (DUF457 family)